MGQAASPPHSPPPTPADAQEAIAPETKPESDLPPLPDISHLVTEDDTPVDNLIQEKLQRLLVQCLYSAFATEQPFLAMADVGLFYSIHQPAIVPDVMLSLGVSAPEDWQQKRHRSYFLWEFGKPPDVVLEIVSNRKGKELGRKLTQYAQLGIPYYVVFDPLQQLSPQSLQVYSLHEGEYQLQSEPQLPKLGLSLTVWDGEFEGKFYDGWLRWCTLSGDLLLTGDEQAQQEKQRAEQEKQRAEQEKHQAQVATRRALAAEAKAARLAALLRAQGIDFAEEE
ncbi:MAG: Uma2 family endonuclease [Spirulinaceae cyanobacterium]